jgi:hypothetical protein
MLTNFLAWFDRLLAELIYGDRESIILDHTMTPQPIPQPSTPPTPPVALPTPPQAYDWSTPEAARHSVRVICDEEGLTWQQKEDLSRTVHCESNYNPKCVHPNMVNGKLSTTDYGIAQINDFWHIGPGKDFLSSQYVLDNPEVCIRWMCKQFLAGNARAWVCHLKGLSQHYSA